jgi:hypothetical protein
MVGGSFASSLHGFARTTQDVDLIVELRANQVEGFTRLFAGEFYVDRVSIEQALERATSFNIIHFESSFKVGFFILRNRNFDLQGFSRRLLRQVDPDSKVETYVQTPEDTLLSKLERYRMGGEVSEQQWGDVRGVLKAQAGRLDLTCLSHWAAELGVTDLLERARQEAGTTSTTAGG